jgi:hypothetical protein
MKMSRKMRIPSMVCLLRPRAGMPMSRTKARSVPPAVHKPPTRRLGYARAPLVEAVVVMVRMAVPAEAPVILTGLLEPKLNMGRS